MKKNFEHDIFDSAMDTILRADPKAVKDAMEREKKVNEEERKARGEHKRGARPKQDNEKRPR